MAGLKPTRASLQLNKFVTLPCCCRAGVDASGTVWLDVRQAGPETWADALCNVNWAEVALRKARLGRIRKLEDRAADALGLG